jgi:hypothetical protein
VHQEAVSEAEAVVVCDPALLITCAHFFLAQGFGRGGGRGGFQQRDMGPPDTVLG